MKKLIAAAAIFASFLLLFALLPTAALTQGQVACEQDISVQAEDTLSIIANKIYGDVLTFPAIVEATNAKAATDSSYTKINNPNVIETGWELCIPSAADAGTLLEQPGATAALAATVGPDVDRVGFPEGYQENFRIFYEFDRVQNGSARVIYANEAAASVGRDQVYPYGSVLLMEVYRTKKDEAGNVLLAPNGRFERDELFGLFVMRKEPGFGTKYGDQRNGEWEYVAYRPDGSVLVPPERTQNCAACHVEAGQAKDWTFGIHRFFGDDILPVGENEINVVDYQFIPATLTVPLGTEVKWVGNDIVFHTVTAADGSFSGALRPGETFSQKFEQPGVFEYFSAIYPTVKGRIEVVNP